MNNSSTLWYIQIILQVFPPVNPLYMPICCTLYYNRKSMGNNELQTVLGKHITYKHQKSTGVIFKADFTVASEYFAASIKRTLNGL